MEEVWKKISKFNDLYEVSTGGRIRNSSTGRVLKPMTTKDQPYHKYGFSMGKSVMRWSMVHRLVAEAFIPNLLNLPVVHHKDHNPANNAVVNLEWSTHSHNTKEAIKAGRHHGGFKMGVKHHSGKFTGEQIRWMKQLQEDGYSLSQIAEIINGSISYISQVINGKRRTAQLTIYNSGEMTYCKRQPVYSVCPK